MSAQPSQFDSHRFVKRLTNAGVSEEVAEILAEEHASLIPPADVATKSDVAEVRGEVTGVRGEVAEVRAEVAEVRAEVAATRAEFALAVAKLKELIVATQRSTLRWMFGMLVAFTGIVFAAMANFR